MDLEAMMTLEGMITISLVIAAVGAGITHLFRNAHSPYLITITGSRAEHVVYGTIIWAAAIGLGVATLLIVSSFASPLVGLALFFGVEAVALDICAHRTRYVRGTMPVAQQSRVRVTLPFNS